MRQAFCTLNFWEQWLWNLLDGPLVEDTLANEITILRAKIAFYFCPALYAFYLVTDVARLAFAGFVLAVACGAADGFDGYVAKKYDCVSESGKCLDPAADGIIVVWGGFVPIILEHHFAWEFLVPIVGIVALGCAIFRRRIKAGTPTHMLAKLAVLTIYLGGVASFVAILARLNGNEGVQIVVGQIGLVYFWAAFPMMTVSTLHYYNIPQLALERLFRGCNEIS